MKLSPTLRCPCKGAHLKEAFSYDTPPIGETAFDLHGAPYQRHYERCDLCGHWFGRHGLDISELYNADYVNATYGGPGGMAAKLKAILALPPEESDNAGRVRRIQTFMAQAEGRRLLDVGAGLGVFPSVMKSKGWEVVAIEPDPRTIEHLRRVVGIEAVAADLLTLSSEDLDGTFDLITFNKVLEHVEDPVPLLAHARGLLKVGGVCYVELPDMEAATEGPEREEFFIEHHHVFSPASLSLMAERAGYHLLTLERLREPSGKFTLRAFLVALRVPK